MTRVGLEPDLESFRSVARALIARGEAPGQVLFEEARGRQGSLLAAEPLPDAGTGPALAVPKAFLSLAELVACHREPGRWALLYRVLWRLTHGERQLLEVESDADVYRLRSLEKAVRRDSHKMKAFVRFRRVEREGQEHFIAWHRPDHLIVRHVAPFFVERFATMRWSILTPDACVHWDLERLTYGEGVPRSEAPEGDALEALWSTYYASTFNPARLNVKAMRAEMPKKHWATLPEARLIPALVRQAPERTASMVTPELEVSEASHFLPERRDLPALASAAKSCQACPLHERATQAVFGEGPLGAPVMFVGEQPGDQEDREGRPFIGPAGQLFNEVLARVGIRREDTYVTNAVKHFGWTGDEKRRLHATPNRREVLACKAWLEAEVAAVKPRMIVCLGATAAQTFLGPGFRINRSRGQVFETPWTPWWMATFHPSALLRMPDEQAREEARAHFEADLRRVAERLRSL
ncbi:UdgX family uracil-DNA binding protein [Hyalangium rubrum]|uniref:Type-4 uracil-DNA glycosylase n=1 Tax=Hyalangium rubrum TaxID=3103134 RepID=A0ABU5H343_9BACT|nr:UdgX family uracil-DNA binding protein [Hyalangium sp. s54d21]MDY7227869.1 UdgX family uracil-DNA binding protein [Hyalangium sp. s54d21]